jgi:enoyl-CoA hydratase/carnithine racemase
MQLILVCNYTMSSKSESEKTMTVKYESDGAVGVVTLAKPPQTSSNDALLEDLMSAYQKVVAEGARTILVRSSMRHFCVAAEVQSFGMRSGKETKAEVTEVLEKLFVTLAGDAPNRQEARGYAIVALSTMIGP